MSLECSAAQTPRCISSDLTTSKEALLRFSWRFGGEVGKEEVEGQKEAESEEMRWGGF